MDDEKNESEHFVEKGMREWNEFLVFLRQELGEDVVQKWMPKLIRFDAANIYLEADSFQITWFEEHVRPRLKGLVNANHRPIKIHFLTEKKQELPPQPPPSFLSDPLDSALSLATFIPSKANQIALELLQDNTPGFNPIYLYGPKGSGKTHLLMGAAALMQQKGKKVFFVRAETFTEHVVWAMRQGLMLFFRKVYREIDALLIDDIHIFARKTATQEEFFHTFNTLHTAGKPIILSASCPPSQLQEIEPRLISRFEWGLPLKIERSDPTAILQQKALQWKTPLSESLTQWLIDTFPEDPILPFHALLLRAKGAPLHIDGAKTLLQDLLAKQESLTPEQIVKWVAAHYGITSEDIFGKSQMKGIALPRQVAMYFCREKLKLPFQKIGALFGRDHSTVMSSIKLVEKGIADKTIDLPSNYFNSAPELQNLISSRKSS